MLFTLKVGITMYKLSKAYRIPIFNETIDFCSFMREAWSSGIFGFINEIIHKYTNANHKCPYQVNILPVVYCQLTNNS